MNYDTMQAEIEKLARDRAAGHAVTWVGELLHGPDRAGDILTRLDEDEDAYGDLPRADLSGQWSDEPASHDILADIGYDGDPSDETATELLDAFESEYASHGEAEVMRILTEHADEDSLQHIESLSVSDLDTMADTVYSPDTHESAGAMLLILVRDTVASKLQERMRSAHESLADAIAAIGTDLCNEIADESPDESHGVWAQFVDLGAWTEDVSELYDPAASDALETAARVAVGEIVRRLSTAILRNVAEHG